MKDDKYVTFKREDWDKARDHARMHDAAIFAVLTRLEAKQLSDAFVLRGQDRFTEAALNAYVSALLTTSEILKDMPLPPSSVVSLCDRLEAIADVAAQRAMEAHGARRMPT